jgi:hypothetical protein
VEHARVDCERLMNVLMPRAEQLLESGGEFYPIGAAMLSGGEVVWTGAYDGRDHPPSGDLIALLKTGFVEGARRGEYKATGLLYDALVIPPGHSAKTDAIIVSLNHRDNYSVRMIFPYGIRQSGFGPWRKRTLTLGAGFANQGEADIFAGG